MELNNKEKSELNYLRGFKKGIEDAMKLVYGEEEISMGIDMNTQGEKDKTIMPCGKIEQVEIKKVTPEEMGKIFDELKNKVLGGNE